MRTADHDLLSHREPFDLCSHIDDFACIGITHDVRTHGFFEDVAPEQFRAAADQTPANADQDLVCGGFRTIDLDHLNIPETVQLFELLHSLHADPILYAQSRSWCPE